jgi:glycosyltransferase involved in cell wall biosynthesis
MLDQTIKLAQSIASGAAEPNAVIPALQMQDVSIVIPAYNEAGSLPEVMPELLAFCEKYGSKLIVVNDGSSDGTDEVLRRFESHGALTVVRHKVNRGYGGAIKSGMLRTETRFIITVDADGQHDLEDVRALYQHILKTDADMIVGNRAGQKDSSLYRGVGKKLIRWFARLLLPLHIHDINSGMKIYDAGLAKRYIRLCPDRMAFSDIITMVFISRRHLVLELPIRIRPRTAGVSTISTMTAVDTVREILNIVILFNPMRVFLPIALVLLLFGTLWGAPILIRGMGVSVGAMLLIVSGLIFFFLGLIAEQLSTIRKNLVDR